MQPLLYPGQLSWLYSSLAFSVWVCKEVMMLAHYAHRNSSHSDQHVPRVLHGDGFTGSQRQCATYGTHIFEQLWPKGNPCALGFRSACTVRFLHCVLLRLLPNARLGT